MRVAISFLFMGVFLSMSCAHIGRVENIGQQLQIIGHRGASHDAPENTLAAFALAADQHADWFELDCLLTRDGVVVVSHDSDTKRVGDRELSISGSTMAELRQVDVGSHKGPQFAGERLPTLAEAFELAQKRKIGVYIEIKRTATDHDLEKTILAKYRDLPGAADTVVRHGILGMIDAAQTTNTLLTAKTIELVRKYKLEGNIVIQSFSPIICAKAQQLAPELRVELLVGDNQEKPYIWNNFMVWQRLLNVAGTNISLTSVTPERVKDLHAAGRTIAVWTVDEPADARRIAALGVDGIITNRPAFIREALAQK
jgi:glycerophosphoryl diester phosphodiesterase